MADPPPDSDPGDTHTTPRWVKVFGLIVLVVALLVLVLLLTRGAGGHGPQRHFSYRDAGGQALHSVAERDALRGVESG